MRGWRDFWREARYRAWTAAGVSAPLFGLRRALTFRRRDPSLLAPGYIGPQTDILIEGFPRSGNSFAVVAFALAQPRDVAIAHHLHAPLQFEFATRWGVPAVALIRDPLDAVTSLLIREPWIRPRVALEAYRRFHRLLAGSPWSYVAASFDRVTSDFGSVIDDVNRRFGSRFVRFEHSEESVARCFTVIEERNRAAFGRGRIDERTIGRPSEARRAMALGVRRRLEVPELFPLLAECRRLFSDLVKPGART